LSTPTTAPVYDLQGISRIYDLGGVQVHALRDVDLTIAAGESVAIVGPSGSGKTTLLQLLGTLDRPSGGALFYEGRDVVPLGDRELSRLRLESLGFVFQQFNLIPTLTAAQNVEVALAPTQTSRSERNERVSELLASVGLGERAHHVPSKLSGGEQQRVAIARALANDPHVLLADEPTGNLDSSTGAEIIDLLLSLSGDQRRTVLLVTHDDDVAGRAERVVRMRDGRLVGDTATTSAAAPALTGSS
jgi:ABC-type lipoprotein export system ATPase subunit